MPLPLLMVPLMRMAVAWLAGFWAGMLLTGSTCRLALWMRRLAGTVAGARMILPRGGQVARGLHPIGWPSWQCALPRGRVFFSPCTLALKGLPILGELPPSLLRWGGRSITFFHLAQTFRCWTRPSGLLTLICCLLEPGRI